MLLGNVEKITYSSANLFIYLHVVSHSPQALYGMWSSFGLYNGKLAGHYSSNTVLQSCEVLFAKHDIYNCGQMNPFIVPEICRLVLEKTVLC